MSVVIRLSRAGTKKRPFYHVVVADFAFPALTAVFIQRSVISIRCCPKDHEERLKLDVEA